MFGFIAMYQKSEQVKQSEQISQQASRIDRSIDTCSRATICSLSRDDNPMQNYRIIPGSDSRPSRRSKKRRRGQDNSCHASRLTTERPARRSLVPAAEGDRGRGFKFAGVATKLGTR